MAQRPELCNQNLNFAIMVSQYNKWVKPLILEGMEQRLARYSDIDTNFKEFAENRSTGFCR